MKVQFVIIINPITVEEIQIENLFKKIIIKVLLKKLHLQDSKLNEEK